MLGFLILILLMFWFKQCTKSNPVGPIWQAIMLCMTCHVYDMSIELTTVIICYLSVRSGSCVRWKQTLRDHKLRQFMKSGGEINQSATEWRIPRVIIWKNYTNNYSSIFSANFELLSRIFRNLQKPHHYYWPAHIFLPFSIPFLYQSYCLESHRINLWNLMRI